MKVHWVLIADASRARLFASDEDLEKFDTVDTMLHAESRVKAADLVSDERGRGTAGPGGAQTAYDRHTDPHRATVDAFARTVAHRLRDGRVHGEFERLVLVAPPQFLGMVRGHLDK